MNHDEYLLGIILSHIWAFLEHYYGFWKVFYTGPSLLKDPFLVDNDSLEGPYIQILKKMSEDIMDRQNFLLGTILSHIWAFLEKN